MENIFQKIPKVRKVNNDVSSENKKYVVKNRKKVDANILLAIFFLFYIKFKENPIFAVLLVLPFLVINYIINNYFL